MDIKQKTLNLMEEKLNHYKYLYRITNHSKKKQEHLMSIKFMEEIIADTKEEYYGCTNE